MKSKLVQDIANSFSNATLDILEKTIAQKGNMVITTNLDEWFFFDIKLFDSDGVFNATGNQIFPIEEFPELPNTEFDQTFLLSSNDIAALIKAIPFASKDQLRPSGCGVILSDDHIWATNFETIFKIKASSNLPETVIPINFLKRFLKINGSSSCSLALNKESIALIGKNLRAVCRRIEGNALRFKHILPNYNLYTTQVRIPFADISRVISEWKAGNVLSEILTINLDLSICTLTDKEGKAEKIWNIEQSKTKFVDTSFGVMPEIFDDNRNYGIKSKYILGDTLWLYENTKIMFVKLNPKMALHVSSNYHQVTDIVPSVISEDTKVIQKEKKVLSKSDTPKTPKDNPKSKKPKAKAAID